MLLKVKNQAEELANVLVSNTQIPHQYFEHGSLFILNVSTSENAIQEYAFYKKDEGTKCYYKFESLTVSWCKKEKVLSYLEEWEKQSIDEMKAIMSDLPLKSTNRSHIDHIISFKHLRNSKKLTKHKEECCKDGKEII
ncbi:hypothetical protein K7887_22110 (plasmid) [Sutcliffiella horikoshii]|uniref:hypothetical protein n=1 Tax=Sutcliffiella horikoshii TaxID=79883 RepID=UPI001CBE9A21|nr:hypothetical protein [Sutcliffiella horikoshii]UAL49816.1 hypothetical protein K7887_22110 [Sutcliffiella horikoshii]